MPETVEREIYLDHHATTPLDHRVLAAMIPYFSTDFGNPASTTHPWGEKARSAVEVARSQIASFIGASPNEIVFTSGATESNNLALKGVALHPRQSKRHLISVATEHSAILDPLKHLTAAGFSVTLLPVKKFDESHAGQIDLNQLQDAITDSTLLVSVMVANNEIGTIQPIAEIGQICRERGVLFHTDAAQALGYVSVDVRRMQIDLLSLSAHKIYGPKGVGVVYIRSGSPRIKLASQIEGGGHERGLRSGTLNVPGIVGMAAAVEILRHEGGSERVRLKSMRDQLWSLLRTEIDDVELNGPALSDERIRLANNLNVRFAGIEGAAIAIGLRTVAVSTGSACTSANPAPSHVLQAIGLSPDQARSSLRFGMGRTNCESELNEIVARLKRTIEPLRQLG